MAIEQKEVDRAKTCLETLKTKLGLVSASEIANKREGVKDNYFYCQKQQAILVGELQNRLLTEIADKLEGLEQDFNQGIQELDTVIAQIDSNTKLLGVLDRIVAIIARIITIFP